jgi:hypothetical protein
MHFPRTQRHLVKWLGDGVMMGISAYVRPEHGPGGGERKRVRMEVEKCQKHCARTSGVDLNWLKVSQPQARAYYRQLTKDYSGVCEYNCPIYTYLCLEKGGSMATVNRRKSRELELGSCSLKENLGPIVPVSGVAI